MNICQCHACALVLVHLACNLLALVQVDCALVLVQVACKLLALVQVKMCNACVCSRHTCSFTSSPWQPNITMSLVEHFVITVQLIGLGGGH